MRRVMRAFLAATVMVPVMTTNAEPTSTDLDPRVLQEVAARQYRYYDELDLARYENLNVEFGDSSRIIISSNAVRFGNLEVTAKLVVPRSDAPHSTGFLYSSAPEPVRVVLDYALVSCGSGCSVGIITDTDRTPMQYKARHETTKEKRTTRAPAQANYNFHSERTASMVLIEGKHARKAIKQLNGSSVAHVFLVTAIHGAAHFEFDTGRGAGEME